MFINLEKKIMKLKGVVSVKLTTDENNCLDQVFIVADDSKTPKKLVRDIETLVNIELPQPISHKKISIAQLEQQDNAMIAERIQVQSISIRHNEPICQVELAFCQQKYSYAYHGENTESECELVLKALIKTISLIVKKPLVIKIKGIQKLQYPQAIVLVILEVQTKHHYEEYLGSSFIEYNLPLAVAKAFFQALNRRLNCL